LSILLIEGLLLCFRHRADVTAFDHKSGRQANVCGLQAVKNEYKQSRAIVIGGDGLPWEKLLSTPPE
jgi:hypothetical protein